jgi:hypothetical protein
LRITGEFGADDLLGEIFGGSALASKGLHAILRQFARATKSNWEVGHARDVEVVFEAAPTVVAAFSGLQAACAQDYPAKTITFIVPYAAEWRHPRSPS